MNVAKGEKGGAGVAALLLLIILVVVVLALAKLGYLDLGELVSDLKAMFW